MSVRVEVRPSVLEWARARSGIGEEDWNRRFPRYERWVNGQADPTLKQLETFARGTHTPVGFLFLDEPPHESVPIPDFRTMGDRPVQVGEVVTADLLDVVYTCQARQEWYRDHQLLNGEAPLAFVGTATTDTPTTAAAAEMQAILGWDAEARARCPSWTQALTQLRENAEAAGVLVSISGIVGSDTHRKLDPGEFRGFALADDHAALVFVNGADSKAAQVFTLAHELAHLWLGETALSDLEPASLRDNTVERWCNEVAAELLVPMDEFLALIDDDVDPSSQLQLLAEHFRVSTQVILGGFREAGRLTWSQYLHELGLERERVATIVAEQSSGGGGNFYNTKPVQVGKRFARALVASTLEGQTSSTEAFRMLGLKKASAFDGLAEHLGVR